MAGSVTGVTREPRLFFHQNATGNLAWVVDAIGYSEHSLPPKKNGIPQMPDTVF